jgi:hypothetical protein
VTGAGVGNAIAIEIACGAARRSPRPQQPIDQECATMAKGMEQKKDEKKKPEKTLKEKRAAKQEKKKSK